MIRSEARGDITREGKWISASRLVAVCRVAARASSKPVSHPSIRTLSTAYPLSIYISNNHEVDRYKARDLSRVGIPRALKRFIPRFW